MSATRSQGAHSRNSGSRSADFIRTEIGSASTARDERRGPGWERRDWKALAILVIGGALVPFALSAWSGSIFIPHDDDWVYRKIALHLFDTHHLAFTSGEDATLVGQILSVQPLLYISRGADWAFSVYGTLASATALVATYCLSRRFTTMSRSLLCAFLVVLAPGALSVTATFMTDIPALAATMVCLALGVTGLDRAGWHRWAWLCSATTIGILAFSIRQVAVAAPLAVLAVALLSRPKDVLQVAALGGSLYLACTAITQWVASIPGGPGSADHIILSWSSDLANSLGFSADLGLALLPAAVLAFFRQQNRLARVLALGGISVIAIFVAQHGLVASRMTGNLLTPQGVAGVVILAGGRPTLFPTPLWSIIGWSGVVSEAILGATIAARLSKLFVRPADAARTALSWLIGPECVLGVFLLVNGGLLVVNANTPPFDRYIFTLVGPAAILIVARRGNRDPNWSRSTRAVATGVAALALTLCSGALALNSNAFDAARWHAGTALAALDIPPQNIDAGYEWFGYHQIVPESSGTAPIVFNWYDQEFPTTPVCAVVSHSPSTTPNVVVAGTTGYRLLEFFGPTEHLYQYVVSGLAACRAD